jgi:uncharacterized protein YdeI (YjbR/CyaY-like superfamily)
VDDHRKERETMGADDLEVVDLSSRAEWREWLTQHHAQAESIWLLIDKKHSTRGSLHYDDVVEEALCFGWIDSRARSVDGDRFMGLMAPRRSGGVWSRSNKERIARLEAAGLMTDAGRAVIEAAKADGSWYAFDDVEAMLPPDDLVEAFDLEPKAREFFEQSNATSHKLALEWIASAKRPETRSRRIAEVVRLSREGIRFDRR